MEENSVVTDDEFNGYITSALTQLYGILIQKFGDGYNYKFFLFNTQPTTDFNDLPPDFYKLAKVEIQRFGLPNAWWDVRRVELSLIHLYELSYGVTPFTAQDVRYLLFQNQIRIVPTFNAPWPVRLTYVPTLVLPQESAQVFVGGVDPVQPGDTLSVSANVAVAGIGTPEVFTAVSGSPANPFEFHIDSDPEVTCQNLATVVNAQFVGFIDATVEMSNNLPVMLVSMAQPQIMQGLNVTLVGTGEIQSDVANPVTPGLFTNVINGVNGWEEFLVYAACIKALRKQNLDISSFVQDRALILNRIEDEAANRDSGSPLCVADTAGFDEGGPYGGGLTGWRGF